MRLWLLRHGEAEPFARTDAERALTERGRNEARRSADGLPRDALSCILASPYVRAQQTAELVREVLGYHGRFETVDWITPDDDPLAGLAQLDRYEADGLLLVSHQPFIGALGGLLVHGRPDTPLSMATGSLAELEGEAFAAGLMRLVSLQHPRKH